MGNSHSGRTMKAVVRHGKIGAAGITLQDDVVIPGLRHHASGGGGGGGSSNGNGEASSSGGGAAADFELAKPDTVLVRVHAAAINPVDYKVGQIIAGRIVGFDFAGVVEKSASPDFTAGQAVYGIHPGALAEYIVAPASKMSPKPESLSFVQAAAMPLVYLTSLQGLLWGAEPLRPGQRVLVVGASGGCGVAALQLARALGATDIVAVCSANNAEFVQAHGATEAVDYREEGFSLQAKFGGSEKTKFDRVYDAASGSEHTHNYYSDIKTVLRDNAPHVCLNGTGGQWTRALLKAQAKDTNLMLTTHNGAQLRELARYIDGTSAPGDFAQRKGGADAPNPLVPVIDTLVPFTKDGVAEGFEQLRSRRTKGKVVFDVAGDALSESSSAVANGGNGAAAAAVGANATKDETL